MTDLTHLDLDPEVRAELEALEAALAGEPGAEPDLLTLVEDVRATREPLSLPLRTRLEEGVAAGFPRERRRLLPERLPRWTLPAMGAAASLLIAVVVVAPQIGNGDGPTGAASDATSVEAVAPPAASSGGASAGTATPQASVAEGYADEAATAGRATAVPGAPLPQSPAPKESVARDRKVERSVVMALRVGGRQLEDASDGVVRVTQALGGYVSTSEVSARSGSGEARFTLRVPSARLDEAVRRLGKLGHVAELDQSSRDITSTYESAADRLADAKAERRALLRALDRAEGAGRIAALRARIAANRSEIAQQQAAFDAVRRRADLSTIELTVRASGTQSVSPGGDDDGAWTPGDAVRDALRVLEVSAAVAVVVLAGLVPVAILALLAWFAGRGLRRRRREAALNAA